MKNLHLLRRLMFLIILSIFLLSSQMLQGQTQPDPLRLGIIGLTHDHVNWILGRSESEDVQIVGIVESNKELVQRYAERYGFSMDIVFSTIEEMTAATNPEAVSAYGSTFEHLNVVKVCAPLGIHVMVEKPLAVSMAHAKIMKELAIRHKIHLLTNYETTWYASNHQTYEMVNKNNIGDLRKIVVHDGHQGPIEIGVSKEFEDWLTDPVKNGGGALTDFGCYGVNLITWLKKGQKPESVLAVTQTIKPEMYPKVDDEATIVLQYPKMQGIVQASWNWPIGRKDMEVYGQNGYIFSENRSDIRYRLNEKVAEKKEKLNDRSLPFNDPYSFFAAVVKNKITLSPYDLSSLENNMIVVEILEAAKKSAKTGKAVKLKKE